MILIPERVRVTTSLKHFGRKLERMVRHTKACLLSAAQIGHKGTKTGAEMSHVKTWVISYDCVVAKDSNSLNF